MTRRQVDRGHAHLLREQLEQIVLADVALADEDLAEPLAGRRLVCERGIEFALDEEAAQDEQRAEAAAGVAGVPGVDGFAVRLVATRRSSASAISVADASRYLRCSMSATMRPAPCVTPCHILIG